MSPWRTSPADTRWAAFPRAAYAIVDNWDTLGMRGTGSRRVVVEDLFVPEHHTVASPNPERPDVEFPGRGVHENPIYRGGTIMPLLVSEPAAVAVGIAQGAIDHYVELLQTRRQYGPASPLRRELTMFQRDLGQATALVDTAEAALMQVATTWTAHAHDVVEHGIEISDEASGGCCSSASRSWSCAPRRSTSSFAPPAPRRPARARPWSAAFATST